MHIRSQSRGTHACRLPSPSPSHNQTLLGWSFSPSLWSRLKKLSPLWQCVAMRMLEQDFRSHSTCDNGNNALKLATNKLFKKLNLKESSQKYDSCTLPTTYYIRYRKLLSTESSQANGWDLYCPHGHLHQHHLFCTRAFESSVPMSHRSLSPGAENS